MQSAIKISIDNRSTSPSSLIISLDNRKGMPKSRSRNSLTLAYRDRYEPRPVAGVRLESQIDLVLVVDSDLEERVPVHQKVQAGLGPRGYHGIRLGRAAAERVLELAAAVAGALGRRLGRVSVQVERLQEAWLLRRDSAGRGAARRVRFVEVLADVEGVEEAGLGGFGLAGGWFGVGGWARGLGEFGKRTGGIWNSELSL